MIEIPHDKIQIGQPRREEWRALAGKENRYPNQFGIAHESDFQPDEVLSLRERGVIFPFEIAEPVKTAVFEKEVHI